MNRIKTLLLATAMSLCCLTTAQANEPPTMTDSQIQKLLAELMANVDFDLMMRIQQTVANNMALIKPYSQKYYNCLSDKGVFASSQNPSLQELIERAKTQGRSCQPILQSFFSQLDTDITQDEFKRGLSPKYQELLQL